MLTIPLILGSFGAGVGMFLAPCTLPLVPSYVGFIAGGSARRRDILRNAFAYVLGFSVVFIILGIFAVAIGHLLGPWRLFIPQVAGAIIILFGLTMLGVRVPLLSAEGHVKLPKFLVVGRWESSFFIGALFALGWSPCIGPILGTVLLVASTSATALQGGILLAIFSAGLALPFILCAALMDTLQPLLMRFARLMRVLSVLNALLLIFIGILMLTGELGLLVTWGFDLLRPFGYDSLLQYL